MKKALFIFLSLAVIAVSCKKKKQSNDDGQQQTYECLPKTLAFTDHVDSSNNESTTYTYEENRIKSKRRTFADGTEYTYNYYYSDKSKGLLDRIDIVINGQVLAKVQYSTQNDKITERDLLVLASDNTTWLQAWEVMYSYNGNKVSQVQIVDHDLWNQGANPTDETYVYTYTGDNVTDIKIYDTSDMNTLKEEITYQYDQGKRAFDNVITQTYPQTRVNNIIHSEDNVYGNNPSTEIRDIEITYNNKNFPTKYDTKDDRNNLLDTETVAYDNCQ